MAGTSGHWTLSKFLVAFHLLVVLLLHCFSAALVEWSSEKVFHCHCRTCCSTLMRESEPQCWQSMHLSPHRLIRLPARLKLQQCWNPTTDRVGGSLATLLLIKNQEIRTPRTNKAPGRMSFLASGELARAAPILFKVTRFTKC